MSTIKDITQWWRKHVSDKIQLTLSMDRVDDWHQEKGKMEGAVIIWRCPHGLYEVFALVPEAASGEYLDDGTDGHYVLDLNDAGPVIPHNPRWWPANVAFLINAAGAPVSYFSKSSRGWIMSTGEILRNNNTGDPFIVRYRKLR